MAGACRSEARGGGQRMAKCGRGLRCMGKRAERLYGLLASPGAGWRTRLRAAVARATAATWTTAGCFGHLQNDGYGERQATGLGEKVHGLTVSTKGLTASSGRSGRRQI